MLDLRNLHTYYIEKYGKEKVAEIVGQKSPVIAMWLKTSKFPVDALQSLLEHDPEPMSAVRPLYENPPSGTKLCVLMPLIGPPEPKCMDAFARLYDRREMGYKRSAFNSLPVARNVLAHWALEKGFEHFYFRDGDMVEPCGDAALYRELTENPDYPDVYAGVNTIYRLLSHRLKAGRTDVTMVSVAYTSRSRDAIPQYGGDPAQAKAEMRLGPRNELKEKPWCGFGGVLIHRSVFEDIIRTQGDELRMDPNGIRRRFGYEYSFFHSVDKETPGDDIPFCKRVARAGHKIHIDLAVHSAHVGDRAYTYKDIK